MRKYMES